MIEHVRTFLIALLVAGVIVAVVAAASATVAMGMHFTAWEPLQPVEPSGSNAVNTAAHDGCPIESPDGLSLYIASNRPGGMGGLDLWVATRSSADAAWGSPQNLGAPINTGADEFCPTPVRGNGLFFVSRKAGGCGLGDIYFTRRNPVHTATSTSRGPRMWRTTGERCSTSRARGLRTRAEQECPECPVTSS